MQKSPGRIGSRFPVAALVAAAYALAACGGVGIGPREKEFLPANLVVIDGANQQVVAGSSLPRPIQARAERNGVPILNAYIWFRWSQPQAFQPVGLEIQTDASGIASFNFKTFGVAGPFTVTIEYKECADYTFSCEKRKTLATTTVTGTIVAASGG